MTQERSSLKKILFPTTLYGKRSLYLLLSFAVFLAIFFFVASLGIEGGNTFFDQPLLSIPVSIAGISGIFSFFTGIYSVIKQKEKAVLVFFAIFWGIIVLIFILGETVSPH